MISFLRLFNLAGSFDRFSVAAKTFLTGHRRRALLLIAPLCLLAAVLPAQTIQFTALPGTAAVENVPYTESIFATISNNDKLSYSASVLPSWLTLSTGSGSAAAKVNNSPIAYPSGVAMDAAKNIYVVQFTTQHIYKITPDGNHALWAERPSGDSYAALVVGDYLYISIYSGPSLGVYRYDLHSATPVAEPVHVGGACLSMTYKDGYLYVAVYGSSQIRKIDLSNFETSVYVSVSGCFGLGFDPTGNLIVANHNSRELVKYDPASGTSTVIISGLPTYPSDVKVDALGHLYVSFYNSAKIRKYTPDYGSFVEVTDALAAFSMSLTPSGVLLYGDVYGTGVYALQTGITLTGTPSHEDVGDHLVKISATNGTVTKDHEFVITVTDPNPPMIVDYSPAAGATEQPVSGTLTAIFGEIIVKGSGNFYIKNKANNTTLQTIDVTSGTVSVTDKILQITLPADLPVSTDLYITADAGVVKDANSNDFAGITNSTTWHFKTIEKAQQTISFAAIASVPYGAADLDPGAAASSGLGVAYSSSDESIVKIVSGKIQALKPGTVTITANQAGDDDYLPAAAMSQVLTVTPKEITASLIEEVSGTKVYDGDTDIELGATAYLLSGLVGDDEVVVAGEAGFDDPNAGTGKTITVANFVLSGKDKDNYLLTTVSATVAGTISPAPLTITADSKNKTYGSADPTFTYQVAGLFSDDGLSGALIRESGKDVGEYAILRGTLTAGNNYSLEFLPAVFTITPAALTIQAENKTRDAWQSNPVFTFVYTGFVENDNAAALSTQPSAQTPASHSSPAGKYAIAVSGASSPNYNISYVNGELTVGEVDRREVKVWQSGSQLHIRIFTEIAQKSRLTLFSPSGQTLIMQRQNLQPGVNNFVMQVGNLAPTLYVLYVHADQFRESEQVRINK